LLRVIPILQLCIGLVKVFVKDLGEENAV